jgi:hypothetical protein
VFARNQDDYTLSFAGDKGLLAFYHYSFGVMIGRMYKLTATFALSANDFAGLNFFAPVFISQRVGQTDINGWFILQEVKEWDGRKTVECELLKIEFE